MITQSDLQVREVQDERCQKGHAGKPAQGKLRGCRTGTGEKSPYRDFAQLNREEIPHLDRACRDNPTAVRLLLFIMQHMDHSNTLLCPYQVFEEYLGLSQATVARGIRYLKDKGFIVVEKKSGAGNRYTLNPALPGPLTGQG